jgi:protein-L-isoaspartate(D-aspartate) O-methyltransferase
MSKSRDNGKSRNPQKHHFFGNLPLKIVALQGFQFLIFIMDTPDTYRHKGLRKKLVAQLQSKGIADARVLEAINTVPRHLFMDSSFLEYAYQDKAFPIGSGQTISQPYTVAFQTELLEVGENMKVLEVGTGSGYQASVLLALGAKVYTVERQLHLYKRTKQFFDRMRYPARIFYKDGYEGLPAYAPYDRILITAAIPAIPDTLKQQLKVTGILVAPVGKQGMQKMTRIIRHSDNDYEEQTFGGFVFVPMLPGKAED